MLFRSACDTCANEEEDESKLLEDLESGILRSHVYRTNVSKVSENERGKEASTGSGKREAGAAKSLCGKRNLYHTNEDTNDSRKSECCKSVTVKIKDLEFLLCLSPSDSLKLLVFLFSC